MLEALKKRIGETGEVLDYGLAWMERQAAETANMDVPVLSKVADAVVNPALVGARATIANVTSGGGKYYQPEVRDEKHFSRAALRELGKSVEGMHGRTAGRADGADNAAQFNLTQTIGGFTVKDGTVTDKFDINGRYKGVPQVMTDVARVVLGREEDPDAGKVRTRIPLTALGLDPAKIKAEQDRRDAARREQHERLFREFERYNREIERLPAAQIRTQQADRAGDPGRFKMSRNVLATDKVPKTIFGFTVVSERRDYTPEDLRFFRENPEAGGYYDMGDEERPPEEPAEEQPMQAASKGGDTGGEGEHGAEYLEAFAQKRKELVQATAERQYLALRKFGNPSHYESALKALNGALDSDARDAALLDAYNRFAEANRPAGGNQKRYDELIEKGRAKYAGGAWEQTMASLTSPKWTPPATQPAASGKPTASSDEPSQGFAGRARETLGVVKDLAELVADGAKSTLDMDEVHHGAAALARPTPSRDVKEINDGLRRIPVMVNGKIDEGGRMRRATDADRAAFRSQSAEIGLQQDAKGGDADEKPKAQPGKFKGWRRNDAIRKWRNQ